jgi:hypothetical protein
MLNQLMRAQVVSGSKMHLFSVSAWPEDGGIRYRDDSAKDLKFYLRLFNGSGGGSTDQHLINFSRVGNAVC